MCAHVHVCACVCVCSCPSLVYFPCNLGTGRKLEGIQGCRAVLGLALVRERRQGAFDEEEIVPGSVCRMGVGMNHCSGPRNGCCHPSPPLPL